MDADDLALLNAYRAGTVEALEKLVERYRKPLFGFILNMSVDYGDADDIFQELWLRAIRNLDRFDNRNFLGWLFRIAHNLVVDRSRRRRPMVSLDADSEDGANPGPVLVERGRPPSDEAAGADLAAHVAAAVATLPADQKEVFLLRVESDLPFKEIAAIQGVSLNTALGRMHYAVLRLRKVLGPVVTGAERAEHKRADNENGRMGS